MQSLWRFVVGSDCLVNEGGTLLAFLLVLRKVLVDICGVRYQAPTHTIFTQGPPSLIYSLSTLHRWGSEFGIGLTDHVCQIDLHIT